MRADSATASAPLLEGGASLLGEDLVARGLLSEEDLAWALAEHRGTWRAAFKLVVDPHSWEKTPHGLTAEGGEAVRRRRRVLGALRPAQREVAATAATAAEAPIGAPGVGVEGRGRPESAAVALGVAALAGWALMLLDRRTR